MSRRLSPFNLAFTLSLLAILACDESSTPTGPKESLSPAVTAAASYSALDLDIPSAGEGGSATSISGGGQVVGYIRRPDDVSRGFIWRNGVSTDLGTLGGRETRANDINDFGEVVGWSMGPFGGTRAFLWVNGKMRGLGTLGGSESQASAINNKSHIVGSSRLAGNPRKNGIHIVHAFLRKNGVMTDLGTLGGSNSAALDINDAGQVVGWSETSNGTRHPFLWQNGTMTDLLPPASASTGTAYAINSVGHVVGETSNRAFRYSGGVLRNLPLGTMGPSVALGIRGGRIIGHLGFQRGFVFAGGEVTLLPLLTGGEDESNEAWAINGAGAIVGKTTTFDSNVHPTMWTPQ